MLFLVVCVLVYPVEVAAAGRFYGSLRSCESESMEWEEINSRLAVLVRYNYMNEVSSEELLSATSQFVFDEELDSALEVECPFGRALVLLLRASIGPIDELVLYSSELRPLFGIEWHYWVLRAEWDVIGALTLAARNLRARGLTEICASHSTLSLQEAARVVVRASLQLEEFSSDPQRLGDFLARRDPPCFVLTFGSALVRLSENPRESGISPLYAFQETVKLIDLLLFVSPSSLPVILASGMWEQIQGLQRRFKEPSPPDSTFDMQLRRRGGEQPFIGPEAFRPAHSAKHRSDLIYLMQSAHEWMEREGLEYILVAGSVLGGIRFDGVNPWEHDSDFCMNAERHYTLLRLTAEQIFPGHFLTRRGVKFLANVRVGLSHKFYLSKADGELRMDEIEGIGWGYPYADLQECHGFSAPLSRGVPENSNFFGMPGNWVVPRDLVVPRRKMVFHGVSLWVPRFPSLYVSAYFESMYQREEGWKEVCRGHRDLMNATQVCRNLDPFYPRNMIYWGEQGELAHEEDLTWMQTQVGYLEPRLGMQAFHDAVSSFFPSLWKEGEVSAARLWARWNGRSILSFGGLIKAGKCEVIARIRPLPSEDALEKEQATDQGLLDFLDSFHPLGFPKRVACSSLFKQRREDEEETQECAFEILSVFNEEGWALEDAFFYRDEVKDKVSISKRCI